MNPTILAALAALTVFGATHEISQKGKTFSSETLQVGIGDEVSFMNDDEVTHNVFSMTDGHQFNLGVQDPGTATATTFGATGDVEVRCAFHPDMRMTVTVR